MPIYVYGKRIHKGGAAEFPKKTGIVDVAQRVEVTLTSAEILALNTTPIALVPAPGAGKVIQIVSITGKLDVGGVVYTGANALEVRYTNGSGVKLTGDFAAAFINAAADRADIAVPVAVAVGVANAAVVAFVPVADPGAGNGTIEFDILYRIVDLP